MQNRGFNLYPTGECVVAAMGNLKIGDSVVVKSGVKDPDLGIDIEGWQGRIVEIEKKDSSVGVAWDSVTLKNTPVWAIEKCETEGLDWSRMHLHSDEVELANPRDTEKDIEEIVKKLKSKYAWLYLGEEGKRIQAVLEGVSPDDYWTALKRWGEHLEKVMHFPFDAEIRAADERGPLQPGDRVRVKGVSLLDDSHGVIVEIRLGRRRYDHPL
jgi:ribosomal protein L24